jgi:hypothetical protein
MGALPMHPGPFEASFNHVLVRTLYHAGTNRPVVALECRILHQCFSLAQVVQMLLHPFLLGKIAS